MYIKPKKSLGQNFLADKNIQRKIIASCELSSQDIVLEVGSGRGELAAEFAGRVKKVYALELDHRLIPELEQRLGGLSNCLVIKGDILKFDINKFARENGIRQKIKVIGNIPYYISSPIIEHLINYRQNLEQVFLTVQKEFARRVVAGAGSKIYGSFSCFVQYYAQAKILFEIKRGSFKPSPKVDSCFLSLKFRDKPAAEVKDEEMFFKIIRTAFGQRRKTLRNSLKELVTQDRLLEFAESAGIEDNVRPEDLSLNQFAELLKIIQKKS